MYVDHFLNVGRMGKRPVEPLDAHRSGAGSDVPHQSALARVKSVNRQASDLSRRELAELTAEELMIGYPQCGRASTRLHSRYRRCLADLLRMRRRVRISLEV
jgi:hypothetical protein